MLLVAEKKSTLDICCSQSRWILIDLWSLNGLSAAISRISAIWKQLLLPEWSGSQNAATIDQKSVGQSIHFMLWPIVVWCIVTATVTFTSDGCSYSLAFVGWVPWVNLYLKNGKDIVDIVRESDYLHYSCVVCTFLLLNVEPIHRYLFSFSRNICMGWKALQHVLTRAR